MTNEQAIEALRKMHPETKDRVEAIDMAIEALSETKRDLSEDLISRQDAINAMNDLPYGLRGMVRDIIFNLPSAQPEPKCADGCLYGWGSNECEHCTIKSAQPEQRWIPCSERLPEDDTLMLVNYIDYRPDAMDIWIGWHEMENVWHIDGEAHSREFGNDVIAWMPLPEPYKEEGEE